MTGVLDLEKAKTMCGWASLPRGGEVVVVVAMVVGGGGWMYGRAETTGWQVLLGSSVLLDAGVRIAK